MRKPVAANARLTVVEEDEREAAPESPAQTAPTASADLSPVLARVAGWAPDEGLLVTLPDDAPGSAPRPTRSIVKLTEDEARSAVEQGQEVLVTFARNAPGVPIIVGLLQPTGAAGAARGEVVIDGDRIVLRGKKEVELRCGQSAVILKEDGLVVVKGATVETRARGVNRIRGGSVKIN